MCHNPIIKQVGLLLEKGSSLDCDGIPAYSSPLIEACKHGHYHIVNRLLREGADVNRYGHNFNISHHMFCRDL